MNLKKISLSNKLTFFTRIKHKSLLNKKLNFASLNNFDEIDLLCPHAQCLLRIILLEYMNLDIFK